MDYFRPGNLDEALRLRAIPGIRIISGGTDIFPALSGRTVTFPVLDTSAIADFRHIREDESSWSLGANATWMDIQKAQLPSAFAALQLAAREVGAIQIQNRGTIGGNICNASPAADGIPPLLTLDAKVEIVSHRGSRVQRLDEFVLGNRRTTLSADEMLTRVIVPKSAVQGGSCFVKLGARKHLVISIAMVAVRVVQKQGGVVEAAIAVGSCSATAKRLPTLEQAVVGLTGSTAKQLQIDRDMLRELEPIDDVRSTADYRISAAQSLIRDCLWNLLGQRA
jgi:CO/xanthine dehydrogenase FAD-binding subunit